MKKKVVSLLLATAMLTTALSACGKESGVSSEGSTSTVSAVKSEEKSASADSEETENSLDEFFEITYSSVINAGDEYVDESYCENMIEEALNIELEVMKLDDKTIDTMLATGQMADVLWCNKTPEFMLDQGLIRTIPIEMVEKYAPNAMAYYNEYPIVYKGSLDPEDSESFTTLRGITVSSINYYLWNDYYRYDWIQKLGIDLGVEVEQIADRVYVAKDGIELSKFKEIMDAFVNQDPDGNGVNDTFGVTSQNLSQGPLFSGYGFHTGVNNADGEAEMYYVLDEFKTYLKDFAQLYADGLVDPEIIQDNRKLAWDKVDAGKAGYWITSTNALASWAGGRPPLSLLEADPEATILTTPGIKPDGGEVQGIMSSSPAYNYCYVNANVDDAKLARILQFLDATIYQPGDCDFRVSLNFGEKGVNWEYNEEGNVTVLNTENLKETGKSTFGQYGQDMYIVKQLNEDMYYAEGLQFWSASENGLWTQWMHMEYKEDVFGETQYGSIKAEIGGDINEYVNNYMAQALLGQIDVDETWDAYLAELDRLGYNEMMAELDKVQPLAEITAE